MPRQINRLAHYSLTAAAAEARILCAFDADPAGDLAARALQLRCPQLQRLRPAGAKDWNELLLQNPSSYSPPPLCLDS